MVKEKNFLSLDHESKDVQMPVMKAALAHCNDQICSLELTVSVNVAGCSLVTKTLSCVCECSFSIISD